MLTPEAQKVITDYLRLPLGTGSVTPYFNNRRAKIRGGLRALIGKGSPEEISDEAKIIALRDKVDIQSIDSSTLKKFLVDKGLGIDCSGFVYHVLDAESRAKKGKPLKSYLTLKLNPLRRLFARLRTAEQVSVSVLASDDNSSKVRAPDAQPGDIIVLLNPEYNHVLVVESVEKNIIHYAHSYAWPQDGVYGHGVRRGALTLASDDILRGTWSESNIAVDFAKIRHIDRAEVRRLHAFQKI